MLPWKSNMHYIFCVSVYSLSYPACNVQAPYYVIICGLSGSTLFFHNMINSKTFRIKLLKIKCVFWFSLTLLSGKCLILRRIEISSDTCIGLHVKYPLFFPYFKKNVTFPTDLWKILEYQIPWNPSSWSRVIPCWWRDKQRMDRWDRQTWQSLWSLLAILWVHLKNIIMTASSWAKNQDNIPNTMQERQSHSSI